jgi:hypothetical protein
MNLPASFPNYYICPISQQPPLRGVTFDIPGEDGSQQQQCPQVFEYSMIYRHIASQGVGIARRSVAHPITRQWARRDVALSFVHDVDELTQERIRQQRLQLGLTIEDSQPLCQADLELYHRTIEDVQNP